MKKVQGALALKKIEYELIVPAGPGEFKKWNPQTRKMPVLDIEGEKLYDSSFICAELEARYPEPPLWSADPVARASQRLLEDWADESLYWSLVALRFTKKNTPATLEQISAGAPKLIRPVIGRILRRQIGGQVHSQGMGRLPVHVVVRELGHRLDDLLVQLGDRPFFHGDSPSIADLAVASELESGLSGPTPEIEVLVADRPALGSYLQRMRAAISR